jgi:hypothetical protein
LNLHEENCGSIETAWIDQGSPGPIVRNSWRSWERFCCLPQRPRPKTSPLATLEEIENAFEPAENKKFGGWSGPWWLEHPRERAQ